MRGSRPKRPAQERFWEKVNKDGPIQPNMNTKCWEWIACVTDENYGDFYYNGRSYRAHRYSYILHYGFIPTGLYICHRCNNPKCVNPEHLYAGTPKDNWQDVKLAGNYGSNKGERNGISKLDNDAVRKIRNLAKQGYSCSEIKKQLNLSVGLETIRNVIIGETWKHVKELK